MSLAQQNENKETEGKTVSGLVVYILSFLFIT